MATSLSGARIQCNVASSKRAAQAVSAAPIKAKMPAMTPAAPAFTPALRANRSRDVSLRAVAPAEAGAPVDPNVGKPEWVALVASAEWMFNDAQNEAVAEQLRELTRYYQEVDREIDYFFVCEPEWLNKFPEASKVRRPAVALVSTDKTWMTFMKLRLDRVLKLDLGPMTIDEATKNTAAVPKFDPPKNWTAPYVPYAYGWWEKFMRNPLK